MAHTDQFKDLKIQLEAIRLATKNFAEDKCIGKGGFGKVYKGEIDNSRGQQTVVALKRLDRKFGQGDPEFWKEIMLLSFYRHPNIVSLLGYCDDGGEKILAYEFASRKSLDLYLRDDVLTWVQRLKICIGAARGLAYLHTPADNKIRIFHRDIKSSNILLDENWDAKIADFGLSKFAPANEQFTYLISNAVGTLGYCDPLYIETGLLTKESDVYSFGVVLFEVLCGRLCIDFKDDKRPPLVSLVRQCYEGNNWNDIICDKIKDEINPISLKEFTKIAFQCLKKNREDRPLMSNVVKSLESALKCQCSDAGGDERTEVTGTLKVKVIKGVGLKAINPYVVLFTPSFPKKSVLTPIKKTDVKYNNANPEWNEEFTLYLQDSHSSLEFLVRNVKTEEMHVQVGRVDKWALDNLKPNKPKTHTFTVSNYLLEDHVQGKIIVEMVYIPFAYYTTFEEACPLQKAPIGTPQDGGSFVVIVHKCSIVHGKHHTNPFVSILFRGELRKTMSLLKDSTPKWEEEFTYMLEQSPMKEEELRFEVITTPEKKGLFHRKEQSLGYVSISVGDILNKRRINKSYRLENAGIQNPRLSVEMQWRTSD